MLQWQALIYAYNTCNLEANRASLQTTSNTVKWAKFHAKAYLLFSLTWIEIFNLPSWQHPIIEFSFVVKHGFTGFARLLVNLKFGLLHVNFLPGYIDQSTLGKVWLEPFSVLFCTPAIFISCNVIFSEELYKEHPRWKF